MGEDHRVDQADLLCQPSSQQRRNPGQDVGPEEDAADDARLDPESDMEPVRHHALDDQPSGEGVQGEQGAQAQHHAPGPVQAEGSFGCGLQCSFGTSMAAVRSRKRTASTVPPKA